MKRSTNETDIFRTQPHTAVFKPTIFLLVTTKKIYKNREVGNAVLEQ